MSTTNEYQVTYADGYKLIVCCSPETVQEFLNGRGLAHYQQEHGKILSVEDVPAQCAPGVEK